MLSVDDIAVIVKGGGDLGSGVIHRLFQYGFPVIVIDIGKPTAVRRKVSFCEAIYTGKTIVEGVIAERISSIQNITKRLKEHNIVPVVIDSNGKGSIIIELKHNLQQVFSKIVLIDATIAKYNLGTNITNADLVIALGPGFEAGVDAHRVIETNRGPNLGQVIKHGYAQADTTIPAPVLGYTEARVIRAPCSGKFIAKIALGEMIYAGELIGEIDGYPLFAKISGIMRGLMRDGITVQSGMKLGDIDPRGDKVDISIISDKARTVAGGVLKAILSFFELT